MVDPLLYVLALLSAGFAAAGLVTSPLARMSRLEMSAPGEQRGGHGLRGRGGVRQRSDVLRKLARGFAPRPHAPPLRQRVTVGMASGIVAVLAGRLLLPDGRAAVLVAGSLVCLVMVIILGRAELPAERRRRERLVQELPQVLELLASAMNAGLPLRAAVREVVSVTDGPLAEELADVVRAVELGQPESDAWRALRDHPQLGRISIDLARSVDSGTMLVAILRRYAALARRDRRGALEARARTVGVKSVPPLMVCFVPAFLLVCVVPTIVSALQHAIG